MKQFLNIFRGKDKDTAKIAKERLQIIISNRRASQKGPNYLPQLQKDLIAVIAKYVSIDSDKVRVEIENKGDLLELNIMLPDQTLAS